MSSLLIIALSLLAIPVTYLTLIKLFYWTLFLAGWVLGVEEIYLPTDWSRELFRYFTAPMFGFRRVGAVTCGYTTLYMKEFLSYVIKDHERFHRYQSYREVPWGLRPQRMAGRSRYVRVAWWFAGRFGMLIGATVYGIKYFTAYLSYGYYDNPYEREARDAEDD